MSSGSLAQRFERLARVALPAALVLIGALVDAAPRDGEAVYAAECVHCHEQPAPRIPGRNHLNGLTPETIVRALNSGSMRVIGTFRLNGPERVAVAEYLTGKTYDPSWAPQAGQSCAAQSWGGDDVFDQPHWNGWGNGPDNTRFQERRNAGLDRTAVKQLKLKWAFAFPGETIAEAQPTVVGGRIFIGSRSGMVYALDAKTGCVSWTYQADGPVKTSVLIAPLGRGKNAGLGAYFGDLSGNTYGLDAASGKLLWRVRVENHPTARIMGSPQFADGQLLIPMTSVESYLAGNDDAACCRFRGSLVSLDPGTGHQNWKHFTVPQAQQTGTNSKGVPMYGPSGATIWSAPSYDRRTRRAYIGTGENYSHPATRTSDAILAVDIDTNHLAWSYQGLAGDAWNMSCGTADPFNCPTNSGPDYDFGSSPILTSLADGSRILLGAQKSGVIHALDPDQGGKLLWKRQVASGGVLGGIEWGPAVDQHKVYISIADIDWNNEDLLATDLALDPTAGGGLVALDLKTGAVVWQASAIDCGVRTHCSPAQTAAVTAIDGVVFAGSVSGDLRAFDSRDGSVIWHYNTARNYATVNGAKGRGGALDATGPVVVDGHVYVASGYSKWGGLPGNVLLAFTPD